MKTVKWNVSILVIVMSLASTAWSHDYWIMPESFSPDGSGVIEAAFTSSHSHFKSEEVPDIAKFRLCMITPQSREVPLAYTSVETQAARIAVPLAGPGTYVLSATSTAAEYWCKTTDGWKTGRKSENKNVVNAGRYVKSVKSFMTVDTPTDSYKMQLGHTIELVPRNNPCTLKVGQTLSITLFHEGRTLADVPVFAIYEGFDAKDHTAPPVETKTAGDGVAKIKIDRPGKWLVFAKYEVNTPDSPHADYDNFRPYMMFEVK